MKTSIEVMEEIRTVLVSSLLPESVELTGSIRLGVRKQGSGLEDIVINCLALTTDDVQEGVFNVNIHVPNLAGQTAGNPMQVDNTQPNLARMEQIAQACVQVLNERWECSSLIDLASAGMLVRDGPGWFYNIRVQYFSPDYE